MTLTATVAAEPAHAACAGPLGFQVCASMSVGNVRFEGGVWKFDLTVTNLYPSQGVSHKIMAAGIGTTQNITSWSLVGAVLNGSSVLGSQGGGWTKQNTNQNLIGAQLDVLARGSGKPVLGGGVLVLTFSTGTVALNPSLVDSYGWHSGNVGGTECSIWANTNGQFVADDISKCTTVIPEPLTMVLLGTGLAGLGGAGALRRRRKGVDVETG